MIHAIHNHEAEIICQELISGNNLSSENVNDFQNLREEENLIYSSLKLNEKSIIRPYDSNINLICETRMLFSYCEKKQVNCYSKMPFVDYNEEPVLSPLEDLSDSIDDSEFITVFKKRRGKKKLSPERDTINIANRLTSNQNKTIPNNLDQSTKNLHKSDDLMEYLSIRFSDLHKSKLKHLLEIVKGRNNNSLNDLTYDEIIAKIDLLKCESNKEINENSKKLDKKQAWCTDTWKRDTTKRQFELSECPICYVPISDDKIVLEECGHIYHAECIRMWMKRKSTCPFCASFSLLPDEFPPLN